MPVIRVPGALRTLTGGADEVEVTAATVRDALAELERRHPGIAAKILDPAGAVKPFIRIYVGADDIGALAGLDTPVGERDEIAIIPAIAGGSDASTRGGAMDVDHPALTEAQRRRYARHLRLPDFGAPGQAALLVSAATLRPETLDRSAAQIAGLYLAAGGVGALVATGASSAEYGELAAHGPDTRVTADGEGRALVIAPAPAWWPGATGDETALAFWRGSAAAARWMADTASR